MQANGVWRMLRTDVLSVTLKFGFYQRRIDYSLSEKTSSVIERLYTDAENWMRQIASSSRDGQPVGRYITYLFRIPATEFTMVPIVQLSDVEQSCLIEIVLVPVEMNQNPHSLFKCPLTMPTKCSKCSRFITGFFKHGFRCQKCRTTYHKECAPFLLDDCPSHIDGDLSSTRRLTNGNLTTLIFDNPFVADPTPASERAPESLTTAVQMVNLSRKHSPLPSPNTIIDSGIFPACIRGAHFYRRYLFCLTTSTLSMTTNLSATNTSQASVSQSSDVEAKFPLTDIGDLVLTHLLPGAEDVFQIDLRNKMIIHVGKCTDSHELQMQTAVFYASIRDQREALINATAAAAIPPTPPKDALPVPERTSALPSQKTPNSLPPLKPTESIMRRLRHETLNEDKDLHELYALTGEKIGEGAFGRVEGAYRKSTHRSVAIKIMEKMNCSEKDMRRINEEVDNLYRFNHVNILKLEAYFERDDAVYLVTERMETDMCAYITQSANHFLDEDLCRMLIYQVIVALRYLHENNCGHLDVKCENILLSVLKPKPTDGNRPSLTVDNPTGEFLLVKLADFGYSRIIGEHSFRKTRVGTKIYNAPEIYHSKDGYNRLADMWSVGIVLYAALSGTLPYEETDAQHAEKIVSNKKTLFPSSTWKNVSKDALDLISNHLLVVDVNSRSKSTSALFHNWFTDFQLYRNLREIERRTKYSMLKNQQDFPYPTNWLIRAREDLMWSEFHALYDQLRELNNVS